MYVVKRWTPWVIVFIMVFAMYIDEPSSELNKEVTMDILDEVNGISTIRSEEAYNVLQESGLYQMRIEDMAFKARQMAYTSVIIIVLYLYNLNDRKEKTSGTNELVHGVELLVLAGDENE